MSHLVYNSFLMTVMEKKKKKRTDTVFGDSWLPRITFPEVGPVLWQLDCRTALHC